MILILSPNGSNSANGSRNGNATSKSHSEGKATGGSNTKPVNRSNPNSAGTDKAPDPVQGTAGFHFHSKEKEEVLRASVLGPITTKVRSISNVNTSPSQARTTTINESFNFSGFAPVGNPSEMANDVHHTFTTTPKIFSDTKSQQEYADASAGTKAKEETGATSNKAQAAKENKDGNDRKDRKEAQEKNNSFNQPANKTTSKSGISQTPSLNATGGFGTSASATVAYNSQRKKVTGSSDGRNQKTPKPFSTGNKQGSSETMEQKLARIEAFFGVKPPKPTGYPAGTKFRAKESARDRVTKGLDFFIPSATASENSTFRKPRGAKGYPKNTYSSSTQISEDVLWPTKAMLRTIPNKPVVMTDRDKQQLPFLEKSKLVRIYNALDDALKQAHANVDKSAEYREMVYRRHPELRQYERFHREAASTFKFIVPESAKSFIIDTGLSIVGAKTAGYIGQTAAKGVQWTYRWCVSKYAAKAALAGEKYGSQLKYFHKQSRNDFNISNTLKQHNFTTTFDQTKSFSIKSAFDGTPYPKDKLQQLIKYLERRNVSVYGTDGHPHFTARSDGSGAMFLPKNPTALQVKHELSHYIDFKNNGFESYLKMGRAAREQSVLDRLQNNRVWKDLNEAEKRFSTNYVDRLNKNMEKTVP